jgi:hypothetical protein
MLANECEIVMIVRFFGYICTMAMIFSSSLVFCQQEASSTYVQCIKYKKQKKQKKKEKEPAPQQQAVELAEPEPNPPEIPKLSSFSDPLVDYYLKNNTNLQK